MLLLFALASLRVQSSRWRLNERIHRDQATFLAGVPALSAYGEHDGIGPECMDATRIVLDRTGTGQLGERLAKSVGWLRMGCRVEACECIARRAAPREPAVVLDSTLGSD